MFHFATKKITDYTFPTVANAWSRKQEREADAYIAKTAFERKDPTILDRVAHYHQCDHDRGLVSAGSHPQPLERAETVRAAAAELREEMRTGRPAGIVVSHDCSPF